jgi:fructose-1,6-bisphosphatase II
MLWVVSHTTPLRGRAGGTYQLGHREKSPSTRWAYPLALNAEGTDRNKMDRNLALEFVRVTEAAALACARTVGRGDRELADQMATQAMRKALKGLPIDGTIVIGEGERDEAPMLYIGEKVGAGNGTKVSIAVDPLEGTNLCANGLPNALCVLAATSDRQGKLLNAPDTYMEKLVVGPEAAGSIDIEAPPKRNLKWIAKSLGEEVEDLTVMILDRPRHADLIKEIREAGARIMLISDGDVSAALAAADPRSTVNVLMGTGGAPEGVLAAAALRAIGGEMQARFKFRNEDEKKRAREMGIKNLDKVLHTEDLAGGHVMFAATGVTSGNFLRGVRYTATGAVTNSVVTRSQSGTVRWLETVHTFEHEPAY